MTTDLFIMPTLPQKPPSSFQCDPTGSVSSDPSSKTERPGLSKGAKHETFLNTLKKVSRDQNPSEGLRQAISTVAWRSEKTDRLCGIESGIDLESVGDEVLNDIMNLLGNDEASLNDETQLAADLNQLMALLEELGLKGSSGERMLLSGAEGALDNMSNPTEEGQNSLAALKQLIGAIQPEDLKPGKDLPSGLERLRQLIANQLAADPGQGHSVPKDGLHLNQIPELENATSINGARAGEGGGGEKPVEMLAAMTRPTVETETVSKEPGAMKTVENSQILLQSENPEKAAPGAMKTVENSQIPLQSENPEKAEPAKPNRDMRAATETKVPNNGLSAENEIEMAGKAGDANRNGRFSRTPAAAEGGQRSGGEALQENSLTGESSPVSKLIHDAQVEKDNPLKVDPALADDAGSKVVKLEAGTNDSSQLGSQSQTFDKTLESASASKEAEAAQRELRTPTMEQIVRRAVIQVRDGQHEARIDLKPDFLGHVRMQVITENHQVTVKILTEFGFVKDMIENNIQQLKADLQQQGLEVDKLDVSVSRDANGNKHQQQNAEHAKNLPREDKTGDRGSAREGQPERPDRSPLRAEGLSTVDYFA